MDGLTLLRAPFPAHQISKLPKRNNKTGSTVYLDYVGHAALTDRLLDADPNWSWEPFALDDRGIPAIDGYGGMWIRLTVCGVTRIGYGHAGDKSGGDAVKEVIGDALRNAAMRFGAALDLWHKGDLHKDEEESLVPALEASIALARESKLGARAAAAKDAGLGLDEKTKASLRALVPKISACHSVPEAFNLLKDQGLSGDERAYLWGHLDSKTRGALQTEGQHRAMAGVPK
jgi:hypothetical protein